MPIVYREGPPKAPPKKKEKAVDADEPKKPVNWLIVGAAFLPLLLAAGMYFSILSPSGPSKEDMNRDVCLLRLQSIVELKAQFLAAGEVRKGGTLTEPLIEFLEEHELTTCPAGGKIDPGAIGEDPSCSIHGKWSGIMAD